MDARQKLRLEVARRVLKALRYRDFRNELAEAGRSGEHVVIPALPDDTMGMFFDEFRKADGTVYIAVPQGEEVIVLSLAETPRPERAPSPDDCPVQRNTQLQMVIDYLRLTRAPLTCFEASPGAMLELVDGRPAVTV